jgi:hypothetical protein
LSWFGSPQQLSLTAQEKAPQRGLAVGLYSLSGTLAARTGVASLPQVEVEGNPVLFSVIGTPESPDLEREVLQQLESLKGEGRSSRLGRSDRKHAATTYAASRYYYPLLNYLGLSEQDVSARDLMKLLRTKGRTPVFLAAIIDQRCIVNNLGDRQKQRWIEGLRSNDQEPQVKRVLNSWLVKLREHCFYTSFGQ